ncbi:hypothetical protein L1049_024253 [Liquidambar formosana]|uniref:AP complex mu/sigma subunit domain-containing protein n=1 Tax=Liquidambar formosana TaxID=63359 RepID=A0AAP0X4F3_LIQFO
MYISRAQTEGILIDLEMLRLMVVDLGIKMCLSHIAQLVDHDWIERNSLLYDFFFSFSFFDIDDCHSPQLGSHFRHQVTFCFDYRTVLCSRAENVSNFMEADSIFGPDTRLVYKHYATLYFVFVFDSSENELAMLDLIQVFVETMDKCFKNVCELDIVFNYSKMHTILDEIVFGGQVLETNSTEVMKAVEEISKLETASNSITLVPKSISSWRSR